MSLFTINDKYNKNLHKNVLNSLDDADLKMQNMFDFFGENWQLVKNE